MATESQIADLKKYLSFPTISADPSAAEAMKRCGQWLVEKFGRMGFEATLRETGGPPVFVAKSLRDLGKPTVLIYGHYDVQPVDPINLWRHPPFEATVEGDFIIARGATDNKGQTMCHILGTEAMLQSAGELPVNLIYLIEGEEEIGSPNLGAFIASNRDEFQCDAIIVSDTSMAGPGFPAITCGLRGIACMEVRLTGAATDLHSGMYGGAIANPAMELARLLVQLHRPSGEIAVPGFYDDVLPPSAAEVAGWSAIPFDEAEILLATGARQISGERNYTVLERLWTRPTAEINGITSGYQGSGSKTIVPAQASAKLSFRLVPKQDPDTVARLIEQFLRGICPSSMQIEVLYDHGGQPFYVDPGSAVCEAARRALTQVFGREPALLREGLSIPIVSLLHSMLGCEPLLIGLGMPDCAAHAPNETFPLAQIDRGIELHAHLLREISVAIPSPRLHWILN